MANLRVDKITSTETFETTGSVQFDGTGDRLTLNNSNFVFGTLDLQNYLYINQILTKNYFSHLPIRQLEEMVLLSQDIKVPNFGYCKEMGSWDLETTVGSFPTSTWVHIAVSRDDSTTYYFIDGKLVYTYTESVDLTAANSGDIVIGNAGTTTDTAIHSQDT